MALNSLREIVVISGKGGTGKTSLVAAFAALAKETVLVDLDVDVPDLYLVAKPTVKERKPFLGGNKASIRQDACLNCGECQEVCAFAAIKANKGVFQVDERLCEGCGVCVSLCPAKAIDFPEALCGEWMISETRFGPMVHACLRPGEENSGKLVSLLKREARALATRLGYKLLLSDGSPGIGCPVVSSLAGASLALIVVEPTCSGFHDFERVATLCQHFNLPVAVIINRFDLNPEGMAPYLKACQEKNYTFLGQVPYAEEMLAKVSNGLAVTEGNSALASSLRELWAKVLQLLLKPKVSLRHYQADKA